LQNVCFGVWSSETVLHTKTNISATQVLSNEP
jgi:hypothetical protein